jgi:hypothetical protein
MFEDILLAQSMSIRYQYFQIGHPVFAVCIPEARNSRHNTEACMKGADTATSFMNCLVSPFVIPEMAKSTRPTTWSSIAFCSYKNVEKFIEPAKLSF